MPAGSSRMGMSHLNGNILCVVDVETTGEKPGFHDIIQICILPLDYKLEPWKDFLPFYCEIQPKYPENYDPAARRINRELMCHAQVHGADPYKAADLFDEWFAKLNLAPNKMISPLAQNWPFDRGFIIDWLGYETFNRVFDPRYRDTMVSALYENDRADFHNEPYPYAKVNLQYLATTLKIDHKSAHDAMADCLTTAKIYRQIVRQGIMA